MNDSTISTDTSRSLAVTLGSQESFRQETVITVVAKDGIRFSNVSLNRLKQWGLDLLSHSGSVGTQDLEMPLPVSSWLLKHLLFFFENWGQAELDKNENEVWDNFARQIIGCKKPDSEESKAEIDLNQLICNFAEIYELASSYQMDKLINFVRIYFAKSICSTHLESSAKANLGRSLYEDKESLSNFEWKFLCSFLLQLEIDDGGGQALDYIRLFRKKYGTDELVIWVSQFNTISDIVFALIQRIADQKTDLETTEKFNDALGLLKLFTHGWGRSKSQSINHLIQDPRFFSSVLQVAKLMNSIDHIETMFTFLVSIFKRNRNPICLDNDQQHLIKNSLFKEDSNYSLKLFVKNLEVNFMLAFLEISIDKGIKEKIDVIAICKTIKMIYDYVTLPMFLERYSFLENPKIKFIFQLKVFFKKLCQNGNFEDWLKARLLIEYLKDDLKSWMTVDPSEIGELDNSVLPDNIEVTDLQRLQEQICQFKAHCPSQTPALISLIDRIRASVGEEEYQTHFVELATNSIPQDEPFHQILNLLSNNNLTEAANLYQKLINPSCDQFASMMLNSGRIESETIIDFVLLLNFLSKEDMLKAIYSNLLRNNRIEEVQNLLERSSQSCDNDLLKVACSVCLKIIVRFFNSGDQKLEKTAKDFIELLNKFYADIKNSDQVIMFYQELIYLAGQNNDFSNQLVDEILKCFPKESNGIQGELFQLATFIEFGQQSEIFTTNLFTLFVYVRILNEAGGRKSIHEMKAESFQRLLHLILAEMALSDEKYAHLKQNKQIKNLLSWLLIRAVEEQIFNRTSGMEETKSDYPDKIEAIRKFELDPSVIPYIIFYEVMILTKSPLESIKQFIQKLFGNSSPQNPYSVPFIDFYSHLGLSISCLGQKGLATEILKLLEGMKVLTYHQLIFKQAYLFHLRTTSPEEFYATSHAEIGLTATLSLAIALESLPIDVDRDLQVMLSLINQIKNT